MQRKINEIFDYNSKKIIVKRRHHTSRNSCDCCSVCGVISLFGRCRVQLNDIEILLSFKYAKTIK